MDISKCSCNTKKATHFAQFLISISDMLRLRIQFIIFYTTVVNAIFFTTGHA